MALNFPDSPTPGQVYTDVTSNTSFVWSDTESLWRVNDDYLMVDYVMVFNRANTANDTAVGAFVRANDNLGAIATSNGNITAAFSKANSVANIAYGMATLFG